MVRRNHLDLDLLDSPLVSPTPLTSIGGVPGSAIAEKIFNDPDSWDNHSEEDFEGNEPEMAWLVGQVEKLKRLSMMSDEQKTIASLERCDLIVHAFQDRQGRMQSEGNEAPYTGADPNTESTQTEASKARLVKKGDKSERLSKNWEAPSPVFFSPASSTESSDEFLDLQMSPSSSATIPSSRVASASATWSFLEWYGIQPGSPRALQSAVESRHPCGLQDPMTSQFPQPPPNLPLPPLPPHSAVPQNDNGRPSPLVRRLPAVPASAEPSKAASASLTVPVLRASLPDTSRPGFPSAPHTAARSFSEQWTSLPSAIPSASSVRTPLSVRSPPPAGPRPKGFAQRGRNSSRSPPRTVAPRPPALKL